MMQNSVNLERFALSLPFKILEYGKLLLFFLSIGNIRSYFKKVLFYRVWHTLNAQKQGKAPLWHTLNTHKQGKAPLSSNLAGHKTLAFVIQVQSLLGELKGGENEI